MPGPSCGQRAMTACVFPPSALEITDYSGRVQSFIIKWAKTSFGRHRPILLRNSCGRGAIRLFFRYGTDACRFCHRAFFHTKRDREEINLRCLFVFWFFSNWVQAYGTPPLADRGGTASMSVFGCLDPTNPGHQPPVVATECTRRRC